MAAVLIGEIETSRQTMRMELTIRRMPSLFGAGSVGSFVSGCGERRDLPLPMRVPLILGGEGDEARLLERGRHEHESRRKPVHPETAWHTDGRDAHEIAHAD